MVARCVAQMDPFANARESGRFERFKALTEGVAFLASAKGALQSAAASHRRKRDESTGTYVAVGLSEVIRSR